MHHYVYVLRSNKDGKLYVGLTNNLYKRFKQHNAGLVKSTRQRRPFILLYFEKFLFRSDAAKREKFFKSGIGRETIKTLIVASSPIKCEN